MHWDNLLTVKGPIGGEGYLKCLWKEKLGCYLSSAGNRTFTAERQVYRLPWFQLMRTTWVNHRWPSRNWKNGNRYWCHHQPRNFTEKGERNILSGYWSKASTVANIAQTLEENAQAHTVIVAADTSDPAPIQFYAPTFAGAAIGEFSGNSRSSYVSCMMVI